MIEGLRVIPTNVEGLPEMARVYQEFDDFPIAGEVVDYCGYSYTHNAWANHDHYCHRKLGHPSSRHAELYEYENPKTGTEGRVWKYWFWTEGV